MNIKDLSLTELGKWLASKKEPGYRAKQIFQWLYQKSAADFNEMTNLSLALRDQLQKEFSFSSLKLSKRLVSAIDSTEKYALTTEDDLHIETVVMPYDDRCTICLSTQVGCRYGCSFCASGARGFKRNLTAGEILDQITTARQFKHAVTHVVFMGMGEPMDNLDNVLKAVQTINSPDGFGIGGRRITISTAGLIDGIIKLQQVYSTLPQIELSISLHAPNNALRNKLMPINRQYPVEALMQASRDYIAATNRQITFEYILIDKLNSSRKDAEALADLLKGIKCQVNLIIFNPQSISKQGETFHAPPEEAILDFQDVLFKRKIPCTLRASRGKDISAACGQLITELLRNGKKTTRRVSF
ncbi:MAG: 23S rRNA (adenine(2503)-C(2))-methyltransferase RlmN [Planctomycetes bacterium]|nr:23S rRNA (adenine(2503)-C(2))-methyltransferase RlmN [Planctomycetota bacterium]